MPFRAPNLRANLVPNMRTNLTVGAGGTVPCVSIATTKSGAFASTWKGASGVISVDWGDGSALENFTLVSGGVAVDHNYIDGSSKIIRIYGALSSVTSSTATSMSISTISNLSFMPNLTRVYLYSNNISDMSAVAGLANLEYLYMYSNNISDMSAVAGLTNLTNLQLYSNNISDMSSVAGLTKLTTLVVHSNSISDMSAVAGLTNLTNLQLYYNGISDMSAVAGLTKLTTLYMTGNSISDMSAVAGLTTLTGFSVNQNTVGILPATFPAWAGGNYPFQDNGPTFPTDEAIHKLATAGVHNSTINIAGTNPARTSPDTDADLATLRDTGGLNNVVTVNEPV